MAIEYHALRLAGTLDLGRDPGDDLHLVRIGARGAEVEVPATLWSLWLPLRGELRLQSDACHWTLPRRHLLVTRDASRGEATGLSLVLAGSPRAWNAVVPDFAGWLPRQWPCPPHMLRSWVHLTRMARDTRPSSECGGALRALCIGLHQQQDDLQPLIDRCSGRTPQRRYLTLQRLLRVRQRVERAGEPHPDLGQLARVANYSPWHLIRMYREVFGETPSEHVARTRLARAWALVRESDLSVCEITDRLGFESQSAFCRAFKNAYGLTTTQARHLSAMAPRPFILRPAHSRAPARLSPTRLNARR